MQHTVDLTIQPQPTDSTCGHTCLQAVYNYWGDEISLSQLIQEIGQLPCGGTMAVQLACHALNRGYTATIYTYNLFLFDPTWFATDVDLAEKLRTQSGLKQDGDHRFQAATEEYLTFLELGGRVTLRPMDDALSVRPLLGRVPILCGLSATFLYQEARERSFAPDAQGRSGAPDDTGGHPVGHFVVLTGYDAETNRVLIADPLAPNPIHHGPIYAAPVPHVAASILLGIATYDANLLLIEPKDQAEPSP